MADFKLQKGLILARLEIKTSIVPGGFEPDADLRRCVADMLWDYPLSMVNPLETLRKFRKQNVALMQPYEGDLEAYFLHFWAKVQKAANENPVGVEFDFPDPFQRLIIPIMLCLVPKSLSPGQLHYLIEKCFVGLSIETWHFKFG